MRLNGIRSEFRHKINDPKFCFHLQLLTLPPILERSKPLLCSIVVASNQWNFNRTADF